MTGSGNTAFLVAQLGGLAAMRFAERLAPLGLSPAQAGLLRAVNDRPGRSQQALSAELSLLPSRLVAMVDELEGDGVLERRPNPTDRRHHALHLTPAGEQLLREIGQVAQQHAHAFLAPLDAEGQQTLATLLGQLAAGHGLTAGVHPGYSAMGRSRP
jgi:DNA-binding MarR family transcriptional regulator